MIMKRFFMLFSALFLSASVLPSCYNITLWRTEKYVRSQYRDPALFGEWRLLTPDYEIINLNSEAPVNDVYKIAENAFLANGEKTGSEFYYTQDGFVIEADRRKEYYEYNYYKYFIIKDTLFLSCPNHVVSDGGVEPEAWTSSYSKKYGKFLRIK